MSFTDGHLPRDRQDRRYWTKPDSDRAVASGILAALLIGAGIAYATTPMPRDSQRLRAVFSGPVTEAKSSTVPLKIADRVSPVSVPCEQQTWPYIDRRCLTPAKSAPAPSSNQVIRVDRAANPVTAQMTEQVKADSVSSQDALPNKPAANTTPSPNTETTGSGSSGQGTPSPTDAAQLVPEDVDGAPLPQRRFLIETRADPIFSEEPVTQRAQDTQTAPPQAAPVQASRPQSSRRAGRRYGPAFPFAVLRHNPLRGLRIGGLRLF